VALLVVASSSFFAQPSSAKPFGYQVSPEEHHPPKKPIGVFTDGRLSHAMGTYSTSLPIFVPPGRNGHTPNIALEYRSDGSRTMFGIGWEIPLDHVRRSLRRGTPRYNGPTGNPGDDEFEFRLGDQTGTLVYSGRENRLLLYRPKIEGAFAKFYYDEEDRSWIIQDTAGRTYYLGVTHDGRDASFELTGNYPRPIPPYARWFIFAWYVERIVDPYHNVIRFEYKRRNWSEGSVWPVRVTWDLVENVSSRVPRPYLQFVYDKNVTPTTVTFRKGWRTALDA
jgi:hypothetical protein